MWDTIWINANLATMAGSQPYGAVRDGAIASEGGRISYVGSMAGLPAEAKLVARNVRDDQCRLYPAPWWATDQQRRRSDGFANRLTNTNRVG